MKSLLAAAAATLALAACGPEYAYVPVTNATIAGTRVAASYPIPSDMPHGDLRVTSFGIVEVAPESAPAAVTRALHVRFTISNRESRDWFFDAGGQRVALAGYGSSVAAFASAGARTSLPIVRVPPLETRVVDVFFPLPRALQRARELPAFEVLWRLDAARRYVARSTTFRRVALESPPDYYPNDEGANVWWGPPYWSNPAYNGATFVGGVELPSRYFTRPFRVHASHAPRPR